MRKAERLSKAKAAAARASGGAGPGQSAGGAGAERPRAARGPAEVSCGCRRCGPRGPGAQSPGGRGVSVWAEGSAAGRACGARAAAFQGAREAASGRARPCAVPAPWNGAVSTADRWERGDAAFPLGLAELCAFSPPLPVNSGLCVRGTEGCDFFSF